jgi:putative nucleotidyltransferase with HDIG domain
MRIVEMVTVGAVIAAATLVAFGDVPTSEQWRAAAFFSGFGLLAAALAYKTSAATQGSITFLPYLSIAVIAPNAAALAAVLVSALGSEVMLRREPIKAVFNVGQLLFAESLAIGVYLFLGGRSLLEERPPALAFLALVLVFLSLNKLSVSTVVSVSSNRNIRAHWLQSTKVSAVYDLFAVPLIFFFAAAYKEFGAELAAALALPLLGMRQLYKTNIALQRINEELLQLMVAAIEARDPYTSGHSQRVARYAQFIARTAGLTGKASDRIYTAALLHDVGKIYEEFAPILRKPGRLTDEEFDVMKTHTSRGAALVRKVSHFEDLVPMVEAHHESWDGRGYPAALVGESIPLGARIIALADTIDAMTTSRPYRGALSDSEVWDELRREAGRQFDPRVCAALLSESAWNMLCREKEAALSEYPVNVDTASAAPREPLAPKLLTAS